MYKQILESLSSYAPVAIGALIIFITFFVLLTIWTGKRNNNYIKHMADLPLNDSADVDTYNSELKQS